MRAPQLTTTILTGWFGIPNRAVQRDVAAKRNAEKDGSVNAQALAQRDQVIRPLIQIPAVGFAIVATTVSAMVVVDDLSEIGEAGENFLEGRVVGAVAMKHHDGRPLAHGLAVWHEFRAVDVDVESNVANGHHHLVGTLTVPPSTTPPSTACRDECRAAVPARQVTVPPPGRASSYWITQPDRG